MPSMTPIIQHAQNVAGAPGHWPDEFLAWYKREEWEGEHRAAAVFLGEKFGALQAEVERLRASAAQADEAITWCTQGVQQIITERDALNAQVAHLVEDLTEEVAGEEDATYYRLRDGKDVLFSNMVGACARLLAAPPAAPSLTVGERAEPPGHRSAHDAWNEALEAAANICDGMALYTGVDCAHAIRSVVVAPPSQPAAQAEPVAPAGFKLLEDGKTAIPEDWTWCRLEWEPGYPEDVAFGPPRMMERLKKWLDKHFASRVAAAQAEPVPLDFLPQPDRYVEIPGEPRPLGMFHLSTLLQFGERAMSAARQAQSNPAAQGVGLPELPEPLLHDFNEPWDGTPRGYTAEQMQAYARAALAQAPAAEPQWQPIEKAPQHREVLCWREDAGAFTAIYTEPINFLSESEAAQCTEEQLNEAGWFGGDYRSSWRLDGSEKPTHWMPLPEAPRAERIRVEGPVNPGDPHPRYRCRNPGETLEHYRIAMGWDKQP